MPRIPRRTVHSRRVAEPAQVVGRRKLRESARSEAVRRASSEVARASRPPAIPWLRGSRRLTRGFRSAGQGIKAGRGRPPTERESAPSFTPPKSRGDPQSACIEAETTSRQTWAALGTVRHPPLPTGCPGDLQRLVNEASRRTSRHGVVGRRRSSRFSRHVPAANPGSSPCFSQNSCTSTGDATSAL